MTKKESDHRRYLRIKDTLEYKARNSLGSCKWKKAHSVKATETSLRWTREYHIRLKIEVLSHYGPNGKLQCSWPDCEIADIDMLSLDHVNNDGAVDRGSEHRGRGGHVTYQRCRALGFPEGFQTLCHNHQWKKELMRRRGE